MHHKKFQTEFRHKLKKFAVWSGALLFTFILFGIVTATAVFVALSGDLPSAEELKSINFSQSTEIMDRTGKLLYTIHGEENRVVVPFNQISPHLVHATLAMEDQNFYNHPGFYTKRIIGAIYYKMRGLITGSDQPLAGASTITQQFAKNAFLTPQRSITRKIKELILALRLEHHYEKDEILEMYLNKIPYGNNAYGIERAAQIYFNKKPKDITIAESAILAALPQAPSRYNPYGQSRYSIVTKDFQSEELKKRHIKAEKDLDKSEFSRGLIGKINQLDETNSVYIRGRSDLVLRLMLEQGYITGEEKQKAWDETQKIEFHPYRELITAPHFVLYIKQILEDKYGKEVVEKGGLKVYTTLDYEIQKIAEEVVAEKGEFNAKNFGASNTGLLSVHVKTGQILAMVGSRDYYNEEIDGNVNIVTRKRQPGSSFKPVVYALGFLKKYMPASVVYDLPTKFDGGDIPKNFDGRYEGPITLRRALAQSRNIPAIKMYFLAGSQNEIIPFAEKMGITALNKNFDYGWPLALGTGELTMLELASAYNIFASNGLKHDIAGILKIEDADGKILEQWKDKSEEVLNPQVAFLINSILSDRSQSFGHKLQIEGYQNAAKTGTSNKRISKDKILPTNNWTFNYTTKLLAAAWAGNNDGSPMKISASGYDDAAPVAKEFMVRVFKARPQEFSPEDFPIPPGIEKITVSAASGKLPPPGTSPDLLRTDYFADFAKPTEVDDSYVEASIDTLTNEIATPYCPPDKVVKKVFRKHQDISTEYPKWQEAVLAWAHNNPNSNQLPQQSCHLHNETTFKDIPTITISSPLNNDMIARGLAEVNVSPVAKHGVDRVEFYLNGNLQYTSKDSPYNGSVRIPRNAKAGQEYHIRVIVYDTLQYSSSTEISVFINNDAVEGDEDENDSNDQESADGESETPSENGSNEDNDDNNSDEGRDRLLERLIE